jgi:hypothetical protein
MCLCISISNTFTFVQPKRMMLEAEQWLEIFSYWQCKDIWALRHEVCHSFQMTPNVRFKVFKAMRIQGVVFWIVKLCTDMVGYQHFGGPCCLHLQGAQFSKTLVYHHIIKCHLVGTMILHVENWFKVWYTVAMVTINIYMHSILLILKDKFLNVTACETSLTFNVWH